MKYNFYLYFAGKTRGIMVQIANPIYDVVFKYLMNDEKVARLLLSAIIGKEVVSLEFRPTEHHFPVGELLAVLRMDFSARIVDADGKQELVILELQKAKMASDIMRFRRYLGEQYANKENVVREPASEYPYRKALPILSIYFLGHTLVHIKAPVVRVNRAYIDAATGEPIHEKEEFIESLTHDSIIIQIPYLKGRRRTELEQLLALFDQSGATDDPHFLAVNEETLPERYRPLLRRLQKALADPVVRQTMEAEDDLIEEIKDYQRLISSKEAIIQAKEQLIEEKNIAISKKEKAIEEKEKTIEEKEKTIEGEQRRLERAVLKSYSAGTTINGLAEIFELSEGELAEILKNARLF
ncbi:MAG: hypothetical protein DYG98_16295 [Haliscomenobacteraceae bacterium CHB4]|nr:hypothetical protein [Haliscomenobacteraceae bacterium CHB4]